jgi:hypothetical protein
MKQVLFHPAPVIAVCNHSVFVSVRFATARSNDIAQTCSGTTQRSHDRSFLGLVFQHLLSCGSLRLRGIFALSPLSEVLNSLASPRHSESAQPSSKNKSTCRRTPAPIEMQAPVASRCFATAPGRGREQSTAPAASSEVSGTALRRPYQWLQSLAATQVDFTSRCLGGRAEGEHPSVRRCLI